MRQLAINAPYYVCEWKGGLWAVISGALTRQEAISLRTTLRHMATANGENPENIERFSEQTARNFHMGV